MTIDLYDNLQQRFSAKSDAKKADRIFIGPEIWKLMNEERFGKRLSSSEKEAWYQFCLVV